MAEINAPLFRKAGRGYNKEDVNSYIVNINRTLDDNKQSYSRALNDLSAKNKKAEEEIAALKEGLSEIPALKEQLSEKESLIARLYEDLAVKDEAIASLKNAVAELEQFRSSCACVDESDRAKAEYYDNLCSKAGEILVIASSTAENILDRANNEAQRIVGDANTKKEQMLKSFSESVDAAADDINVYIRNAVEECISRINKSVSTAKVSPNSKKDMNRADTAGAKQINK